MLIFWLLDWEQKNTYNKLNSCLCSDEHSGKVKSFMLDVLCPLITESDNVSSQLLDIILINIVEPQKSSKKNAYHLAKDLIIKTNETMEQYIQQVIRLMKSTWREHKIQNFDFSSRLLQFFNQALVMDKVNKSHQIASRIYDLIYELNVICPSILLQVLPQLECKLKAGSESERLSKFFLHLFRYNKCRYQKNQNHCSLFVTQSSRFCRGRCSIGAHVFGEKFDASQTIQCIVAFIYSALLRHCRTDSR